ncbi:MAG TPA: sterol carrier protein domain-containing protein, partial [Iamia sp.]|nr:sterol carrier protein domain-containing protein [Iamia sp.]
LTASESVIYGRFGYGLATRGVRQRLAVGHARLRPDAPAASGRLRVMTIDEARAALPAVYERIRVGRPGWVRRSEAWWETHVFLDRPDQRDGATALYVLGHHDDTGLLDGWATYRVAVDWRDRLPASRVVVEDIAAVDDAVQLALWQGLVDVDLSVEVDALHVAVDDPLPWAVADPRRVRTSELSDWLWLRILDVPAALGPRRWGAAGRVVLDVVDPFRPASGGRFAVEADATGAGAVTATDEAADLLLGAEELGAVALGGVAPSLLARAGRIAEERPGALAVADALFRAERAPHCATMF